MITVKFGLLPLVVIQFCYASFGEGITIRIWKFYNAYFGVAWNLCVLLRYAFCKGDSKRFLFLNGVL